MYYKIIYINEVPHAAFLRISLILVLMIPPILMISCIDNLCDESSEENNLAENCIPEMDKFLCHNNVTCLTIDKVCDGIVDCPDFTDETFRCSNSNNCYNKVCPPASKCQMMPQTGPECICPKGFKHSLLEDVCADVDECLVQYGVCSQICINVPGSYRCTCDNGYRLKEDNRTCEASGEEALLLYTTQVTVMGVNLKSKRVYTVATNLTKVIGVTYNGEHIYWTNIQNGGESIVKANPDGTQKEILLTSGIDAPEDIAVDWLTGNIYFSDNAMHHIAVCSNDGLFCTVLVTDDVNQPRGVALWPQRGQIFWSDWGINPMIARASMDGSNSMRLVTENIHWPNGVALDMYNDRVYWVDAKMAVIESVRTDGTDRKVVLEEILKHPYGLAVFEDNIYWSDWATKSIHFCNKFTGKDHKIITNDSIIYAVHIYHSSKQKKVAHACERSRCSHLCLLGENNTYSCACPEGMHLAPDHLRCIKTHKKQRLFLGVRGNLLEMEHTTFGRHRISTTHKLDMFIHELAYNSVNNTVFVADNFQRVINEVNLESSMTTAVIKGNLRNITGLAFDHLSFNLYWCDSERHVVEVYSLQAKHRAIISIYSDLETPIGLAVIPDDGIMFIALKSSIQVQINQKSLNGQEEYSHVFDDEQGDNDIKFATDFDTNTLYWADSDLGRISFSDYSSLHANTFRDRLKRPYSIAILDEDLFWTELGSNTIHWTHKSNLGPLKRFNIEVNPDMYSTHSLPSRIPLLASTPSMIVNHPCQHWNGGCSHICVTLGKFTGGCLCPAGLVFKDVTNRTCIEALDCEFRCRSGECLTLSRKCNGRKDCSDGSDEEACDTSNSQKPKVVCPVEKFMCHNAEQCLESDQRCDGKKQCHDGSDEDHCDHFNKSKNCHRHQHVCNNGNCVDFSVMCDGVDDCGDNSDEENCKLARSKDAGLRPVCTENMFQCNSGTCIAQNWECDGKIDCPDGSDEHDKCELKQCHAGMYKCNDGTCIDNRLVCDGHNDCGDMSDEQNCDIITCGEEKNPLYVCASNTSLCLDHSSKCNGIAECPQGEDEVGCNIKSEKFLFFSVFDEVRSITLKSPFTLKVMWKTNGTKISGFDLNIRSRNAYFTTDHANILYMVDVKTEIVEAVLEIAMPGKVALDWITDNVYVISRSQINEIQVCSFLTKMCSTIVKAQSQEIIKALTVDAYNRRLFYVIVQIEKLGLHSSQIATTNLDGTNLEYILSRENSFINTLACDPHKEILYFTDLHEKTLQAINYSAGSSNRVPIPITQKRNVIFNPAGLSWYENQIFIANFGERRRGVIKCELNGTKMCKSINLNNLNTEDILIDDAYRQPINRNPCAMAKCQDICVLSEFSYRCMNKTQYFDVKNEITLTNPLDQNQSTIDNNSPHFAVLIWLLITFLVLLLGYTGYFYCHRYQQGRWNVIHTVHNPLISVIQQQDSKSGTLKNRMPRVDPESSREFAATSFEVKEEKVQIGLPI